jgi:hypothetical protein
MRRGSNGVAMNVLETAVVWLGAVWAVLTLIEAFR